MIRIRPLANGKSILNECIAEKSKDTYDVFIFERELPSYAAEIQVLRTPSRPTLIIFDDYLRHLDAIEKLRVGTNPNQQLLVASRTISHLTSRARLLAIFGEDNVVEFRIDTLRAEELNVLDSVLASSGLLGSSARLPKDRRIRELYQSQASGELRGILLWLLAADNIQKRVKDAFQNLGDKHSATEIVITAMVLTHIGQLPHVDDLAEFVGAQSINQALFSESSAVSEFVHLDKRTLFPSSVLFATSVLRTLWSSGIVANVMEEILRRSWQLRWVNVRFNHIARDLMRYSLLRRIVPQNNVDEYVNAYYDQIRDLDACANNELFWLQSSICNIARKKFELAERHLAQSYALASRRSGFDTYQIDNVRASFLLAREIEERRPDRSLPSFVEANRILIRQLADSRHAYYPYRVAARYGEFWDEIAVHWDRSRRNLFESACRIFQQRAEKADSYLSRMPEVSQCLAESARVLSAIAEKNRNEAR